MRGQPVLVLPRRSGLVLLSALLFGLAHPPFHLLLPSFTALVPLGIWLLRLPDGAEGRSEALRGGLLFGLVGHSLVLHWLIVSLATYTWLAPAAFLIPVVLLSVISAAGILAVHLTRSRLRWPLWLALPVFWTAAEWIRGHLGPASFPWLGLGDTLTGYPQLAGGADLVGSRGLSLWLATVNALLAVGLDRILPAQPSASRRSAAPALGLAAVLAAAPIGYSFVRWGTLETRIAARVAIIQPSVPEELKLRVEESNARARQTVDALLDGLSAPAGRLDLLVLPETVVQATLEPVASAAHTGDSIYGPWASDLARRSGTWVVLGAWGATDRGDGSSSAHNSALLLAPDGSRVDRYDKRRLVPGVEWLPVWGPRTGSTGERGGFTAGTTSAPLEAGRIPLGVLICYESIFADLARAARRAGAAILVNLTNDAWFGRQESSWLRTNGLVQHPAHLVMRAIENRVGIVRAANTGISGVVDPSGRWRQRTELYVPTALTAPVLTTDGLTVYARMGDVAGWLSALVGAAAILGAGLRGPRSEER